VVDKFAEPVYLLGHSYGGVCALEAALYEPAIVSADPIRGGGSSGRGRCSMIPGLLGPWTAVDRAGRGLGFRPRSFVSRLRRPQRRTASDGHSTDAAPPSSVRRLLIRGRPPRRCRWEAAGLGRPAGPSAAVEA
jgi:hypothetical protein